MVIYTPIALKKRYPIKSKRKKENNGQNDAHISHEHQMKQINPISPKFNNNHHLTILTATSQIKCSIFSPSPPKHVTNDVDCLRFFAFHASAFSQIISRFT